jgi:hypothetical protein
MRLLCGRGLACLLWLLSLGASAVATTADAAPAAGVRVEVSASPADASGDFEQIVRAEVGRRKLGAARGKHFVLSAKLVELDTRADRGEATIRCRVSMALRGSDGDIKAILRGGARASGAASQARDMRRIAMETAVEGALGRLEEALTK